jgi:hypothetical protein
VKRGVVVLATLALAAQSQPVTNTCAPLGRQVLLPTVPEASGVAQAAGALWTHNDSDGPVLFRIDSGGVVTPVTVSGANVVDWEDIGTGTCSGVECLYIADIGDNRSARDHITIYQVAPPQPGSTSTRPAEAFHARYPDSPHDAEALLLTRQATWIITKDMPPRVYRFQRPVKPGETGTLALVRTLKEAVRITGAAASPDGRWVALRSNGALLVYTADAFDKGGEPVRINLEGFKEAQGEGIAFGQDGELYLVSEGGGKNAAGVLTRVRCAFIR